jgi:hypothetical protein
MAGGEVVYFSFDQWMGVIRLGAMFEMKRLCEVAVRNLERLFQLQHALPVLVLVRTIGAADLVDLTKLEKRALDALVARPWPLETKEEAQLDSETIECITRKRKRREAWEAGLKAGLIVLRLLLGS